MGKIFQTDKKIRLGIWGLGRGRAFIDQCEALNIEVVAGCDINEMMCNDFRRICPGAFVTRNEDEFLACDMDAVLVATYFFAHADNAVKVLNSGRHVLSEVSAFFTPAEGVRLVEAVEKSGKLYMLGENYADQFVKKLWQQGIFGELAYAEFDYVHECRALCYSYLYGDPMMPGNTAHSWRSWLNFHYYCTHSLGAAMEITGTRPVKVCAPPSPHVLPGYIPGSEMGSMAPSFVTMDNGGIVRNLMGAGTADSHTGNRIWGTKAFVELDGLTPVVTVGRCGRGPSFKLTPPQDQCTALAATAGHNGGDFWVLYHFADALLNGTAVPWDIYRACDVTLTGIMAVKSQYSGGIPVEVPDFRKAEVREQYRNDHFAQKHFDPKKLFPEDQDLRMTKHFSNIMGDLDRAWQCKGIPLMTAALDGMKLYPYITDQESRMKVQTKVQELLRELPALLETSRQAKELFERYPDSLGGQAMRSLYESGYTEKLENPEAFRNELKNWLLTCNLPKIPLLQMELQKTQIQNTVIPEIPAGFTLRKFRAGEEAAYTALMLDSGFETWHLARAEEAKANAFNEGIFFLVEDATGRLAATAMANKPFPGHEDEGGGLGWVAVHPDFRGRHLAEIVCNTVIDHFRKAGFSRLWLLTNDFRSPAIRTYLKAGWRPVIHDEEMRKRWDRICKKLDWKLEDEAVPLKADNSVLQNR